jgi:tripartite-type tricarboxylate transporter receptor subunit TctC
VLLALACSLAVVGCGPEGPYPSRELRLVVQASPGGMSDAISRYVARGLQERLGVPVVAENRVGAAGMLAFSFVSRSRPDGYTFGYAPVELAILPHLGYSRVTIDDFDFLALHTRAPAVVAVRDDAAMSDLDALRATAQGRRVTVGTSGTGSIWHLAGLAAARALGVELTFVPFGGSSQAVTALLGGHVDAVVAGPLEVDAHVRAGAVRPLGVMADERSPLLPDVPTFTELGHAGVTMHAWGGFVAPRNLPPDRRERLVSALVEVLRSPEFEAFARERGLDVDILVGGEFEAFVREEMREFEPLVRRAGLGLAAPP